MLVSSLVVLIKILCCLFRSSALSVDHKLNKLTHLPTFEYLPKPSLSPVLCLCSMPFLRQDQFLLIPSGSQPFTILSANRFLIAIMTFKCRRNPLILIYLLISHHILLQFSSSNFCSYQSHALTKLGGADIRLPTSKES